MDTHRSTTRKKPFYRVISVAVILLLAIYFSVTSSFFLTRVVAPAIGYLIDANFTVGHARYNPFTSYLEVHDVVLGDKNNPFLVGKSGHCHVDLLSLFELTLKFSDIHIDGVNINFIKNKKGRWSIPWLYVNYPDNRNSSPIKLDFTNIHIKNLNLKYYNQASENSVPLDIELNNLALTSKHFKNGLLSLVNYKGNLKVNSGELAELNSPDIKGSLYINLDSWYIPSQVKISNVINNLTGTIRKNRVAGENLSFATEINRQQKNPDNYEIKYVKIREGSNSKSSKIDAEGHLNFSPFNFFLYVKAEPIRYPLLSNLTGLFGNVVVEKNVKASYVGNVMVSTGEVKSKGKLSISRPPGNKNTSGMSSVEPAIDFFLRYDFGLNFERDKFLMKTLDSTLIRGSEKLITAHLNKPLAHYYGKKPEIAPLEPSSTIKVKINDFSLKLLNGLISRKLNFASGTLSSDLELYVSPLNNDFMLDGKTMIKNLLPDTAEPVNGAEHPVDVNIGSNIDFNFDHLSRFRVNNCEFNVQIPNGKNTEGITFLLTEPFSFEFNQDGLTVGNSIKFRASGNKIHLKDFLNGISAGNFFSLDDGILRYNLNFEIPESLDAVRVGGYVGFLYLDLCLFGKRIKNLSISNTVNAEFCDTDSVKLKNSTMELYVNGVRGLVAKTNGRLAFNKRKNSSLTISVKDITKFLPNFIKQGISNNIKDLQGNGKIYCDYNKDSRSILLAGKLDLSKLTVNKADKGSNITGYLGFAVNSNKKRLNLNKIHISLAKNRTGILSLGARGNFPVPFKDARSTLNISSQRFALGELIDLYNALTEGCPKTALLPVKEYPSVDLNGLDLKCRFDFNNLRYKDLLESELHGNLNIKNNKIYLSQQDSQINGREVKFQGCLDVGKSGGFPYKFYIEAYNLDLNPFLRTFVLGDYKKTSGKIDKFLLSIQGKGFTKENLEKYLAGELNVKLSNLSLPYQIEKYKILKITLIPLELLGKIRGMIPGGLLISNFERSAQETANIFKNLDNINLSSGEIFLIAERGKVYLEKVRFEGSGSDLIKKSEFLGTIDYNGKLQIGTKSDISGLHLPLDINGTLDDPSTNMVVFLPKFITVNTFNILNPMNIVDLIQDTGKGLSKTIEGTKDAAAGPQLIKK